MGEFIYEYYNENNDTFGLFFNNIHIVLMKTFIIHPFLMNENLTCTTHIMKRRNILVFTYLLNRENYRES